MANVTVSDGPPGAGGAERKRVVPDDALLRLWRGDGGPGHLVARVQRVGGSIDEYDLAYVHEADNSDFIYRTLGDRTEMS